MTIEATIDRSRATDYETIFILRADIDSDASEKAIARVLAAIEAGQGKLLKVESWGKRRLAYAIGKQRKGFYVYVRYLGYRGVVAEVERNLRMLDTVLRHLTVALRKNVDPKALTVDPEDVKVRRIEIVEGDEDKEENIESSLGLSDDRINQAPRGDRYADVPAPEPTAAEIEPKAETKSDGDKPAQ
ncbi:MAG: 30S ribosomal protein S6 [Myxococcales bacterium]|nr:30S ribosomal protein S6 [Myxococcales bacterium]